MHWNSNKYFLFTTLAVAGLQRGLPQCPGPYPVPKPCLATVSSFQSSPIHILWWWCGLFYNNSTSLGSLSLPPEMCLDLISGVTPRNQIQWVKVKFQVKGPPVYPAYLRPLQRDGFCESTSCVLSLLPPWFLCVDWHIIDKEGHPCSGLLDCRTISTCTPTGLDNLSASQCSVPK